mmetsp:Transcript_9950/g.60838  ORF Transcript_9950/g.60838 Transcript_9950/m.60838 type:complete len:290 (+) Transcript_9950:2299-3168(+)
MLRCHTSKLNLNDVFLHRVVPRDGGVCNAPLGTWGQHDLVFQQRVFLHDADDISPGDDVSDLHARCVFPELILIQRLNIDPSRYEAIATCLRNASQGALDPVEDLSKQTRSQLHTQRLKGPLHRISYRQSGGFFVDLQCGIVSFQSNDFSDELLWSHTDEFIHCRSSHPFCNDHWSRHLLHASAMQADHVRVRLRPCESWVHVCVDFVGGIFYIGPTRSNDGSRSHSRVDRVHVRAFVRCTDRPCGSFRFRCIVLRLDPRRRRRRRLPSSASFLRLWAVSYLVLVSTVV